MDDPVRDIEGVVLRLTEGSPSQQEEAINEYFADNASFTHPFCSISGNRSVILRIFQWYKILSPKINLSVNSVAYDSTNLLLYVGITQVFAIWFVPFHSAKVNLTTVLQLQYGKSLNRPYAASSSAPNKYYIQSQNDLYQVTEWLKFISIVGIATRLVMLWQWLATLACIVGAVVGTPIRNAMASGGIVYSDQGVDIPPSPRPGANGERTPTLTQQERELEMKLASVDDLRRRKV